MTRSRIGPLALESPLGERGSNLFRAVHIQQKAQVAVRVFSVPMGMTPEAKQEFADQLESLKALRHPNIVRCYGGGFDAKDAYLVYELMHGESLQAILKRKDRLPWESVLDMGLQICEGLQVAHQSGWMHGRIRPDKVIVSQDETKVKLCDFRRGPGSPVPLTAEQLAYCAPESLEGGRPEAAWDLYSVGAILYHAMTGQSPFPGKDKAVVAQDVKTKVVPPVATIVFDCPVWLSAIVEQLLHKDPLKRPFSAAATAMALREAHRRASEGIGVAEHMLSGFSPLQLNTNREEAAKALGKKKSKKKRQLLDGEEPEDVPGILERPLILLGILVAAVCLIAFMMWPAGEKTIRARAEALIAKQDLGSLNDARDKYLFDLIERFPNGANALWAQDQLDLIEMQNAEARIQSNRRFGRKPSSEGERKYAEANRIELEGDRVRALEQYRGIVSLLKDEKKERAYVNLARRQIDLIVSNPPSVEEIRRILTEQLEKADKMQSEGDTSEAKKIWEGIVSLYSGNKEMQSFVEQSIDRLEKSKNP